MELGLLLLPVAVLLILGLPHFPATLSLFLACSAGFGLWALFQDARDRERQRARVRARE
jgi:hypothetical protein